MNDIIALHKRYLHLKNLPISTLIFYHIVTLNNFYYLTVIVAVLHIQVHTRPQHCEQEQVDAPPLYS